jgi:bacillithiol biosynthesis cysteine-adding enzyme BshC
LTDVSDATPSPAAGGAVREAVDLGRLPWIRPLVRDYSINFGSVARLFAGNPSDPAAWRDAIARVQRSRRRAPDVAALLTAQIEARGGPAESREAAARLADASTVAILTGQQAGIFGGPLYTLLKAVTTIQLARRVEREHGVPVVPVFWVDGDDHDWEEVRSAAILDADFDLRSLSLDHLPGAGTHPVSSLALDARVETLIETLGQALPASTFTQDVLAAIRRHYCNGRSLPAAFAGWLEELLGRQGLVVYEASDPVGRGLVRDVLAGELAAPGRTAALARAEGEVMRDLGHAPQVEPTDDNVALFYVDAQGRQPIVRIDGGLKVGPAMTPREALQAEALARPERFSPNVLLRPIVQDSLFPTICYVAGPSELAYHAQLGRVYEAFDVPRPLLYSRGSATLLDSGASKFLERSQLPFEQLAAQDESALNRLLRSQLPPGLDEALDDLDRLVVERLDALRPAIVAVDPTLAGALDTTGQKARDTLKTLQGKIVQASKRKDETLRRQFVRARALSFPGGVPQERRLSTVFFVNRYGLGLGERLLEVMPEDTHWHYLVVP